MTIRTLTKLRFVILVLLAGFFSHQSFSATFSWGIGTGGARFSSATEACGTLAQQDNGRNRFDHLEMVGGNQADCYVHDYVNTDYVQLWARLTRTGDSCVSPAVYNSSTGGCDTPVNNCIVGESLPVSVAGASPQAIKTTTGTQCTQGCAYQIGTPKPVYASGSNCSVKKDGSYVCYFNGTGTGTQCTTSSTPSISTPSGPVEAPTTTTSNDGNGTTKTSTTETTVNSDGTVTTTTTTITNNGGNSTTSITSTTTPGTGNATVGNGTTGNGEGEGEQGEGAGDCDPTAANYFECAGLKESIGDDKAQQLKDAQTTDITQKLDDLDEATQSALEGQKNDPADGPSGLAALVKGALPSPGACSTMTMTVKGHSIVLTCEKFDWFKTLFGWFLAVSTVIYIFRLATKTQG